MMKYLQKLGKSLMLPVAVLPAAAILMGLGYGLDPTWGTGSAFGAFLIKSGSAIIDNLPILFAVGVAIGMSKKQDGAAALSGLVAFLVVTTLLKPETVALLKNIDVKAVDPAFGAIANAFTGIISGLVASACFNKFHRVQLPQALSFFSGKRCVPIVTSAVMLVVAAILFFSWPVVYNALVAFGTSIKDMGPLGAGIYAFSNRLLIPTGLHHALNQVFWQNLAGINDIPNFWSPTAELIQAGGVVGSYRVGMYQAGFFPVMMFGLPGAALAMYHTAKSNKKKVVAGLLIAASFSTFLTGVTEPLEFAFMFLAPALYVVHAVLTGISVFIAASFGWMAGFGFSAGLIDFLLSSVLPMARQPYMLLVLGAAFFVIYYILFRFLIVKFNLKTPGREDDDDIDEEEMSTSLSNSNFDDVAKIIYEALGGSNNVISIDNCITRLRVEVKDSTAINERAIKATGAAGIIRPSKTSVQVVIGTQVEFVAEAMKKL